MRPQNVSLTATFEYEDKSIPLAIWKVTFLRHDIPPHVEVMLNGEWFSLSCEYIRAFPDKFPQSARTPIIEIARKLLREG